MAAPWPDSSALDPSTTLSSSPLSAIHLCADKPLSGPGTSRQTRRLQLRNAGFRAPSIAPRRVTPQSTSEASGMVSASIASMLTSSDAENCPPTSKAVFRPAHKKRSSSILKELGAAGNLKKSPSRPSSSLFSVRNDDSTSPPSGKSTLPRARSLKNRAKASHRVRRSISAEKNKYIDHLESELASAHAQLSSVDSPNNGREQSVRMRALATELRQLQQEVADWEHKYEDRIREVEDTHAEIEVGLRAHVRALEKNKEESDYRIQELDHQLQSSLATTQAVEDANVNLEKRLELMSELLAASPNKLPLHPLQTEKRRRQDRPMSLAHRLSTAGSTGISPERTSMTRPASPAVSRIMSPRLQAIAPALPPVDTSIHFSDFSSDAASIFSEAPMSAADSITSVEHSDSAASSNPWASTVTSPGKGRARRMRRFGGGSVGPKPLILPSTNYFEHAAPSAAPALPGQMMSAYRFPRPASVYYSSGPESPTNAEPHRTSVSSHHRSDTEKKLEMPWSDSSESSSGEERQGHSKPGEQGDALPDCHFLPEEPVAGRNLMEELSGACSSEDDDDATESGKRYSMISDDGTLPYIPLDSPIRLFSMSDESLSSELASDMDEDETPTNKTHSEKSSRRASVVTTSQPSSAWDRLRAMFGDLCRTPVDVARHLILTAQNKMRVPEPLRNVQWWLVGILLGPMAKRRLLRRPPDRLQPKMPDITLCTPKQGPDKDRGTLAYGTMYETPPNQSCKPATAAERRRRRRSGSNHWSKHSPWLWLKFSITLAFAVGVAFKDGPGSLMKAGAATAYHKIRTPKSIARAEGDEGLADAEDTDG